MLLLQLTVYVVKAIYSYMYVAICISKIINDKLSWLIAMNGMYCLEFEEYVLVKMVL